MIGAVRKEFSEFPPIITMRMLSLASLYIGDSASESVASAACSVVPAGLRWRCLIPLTGVTSSACATSTSQNVETYESAIVATVVVVAVNGHAP